MKITAKKKKTIIILSIMVVFAIVAFCLIGLGIRKQDVYAESVDDSEVAIEDLLLFKLNSDGTEYGVKVVDRSITEITIPKFYSGKPVTEILDSGFINCVNLKIIDIYGIKKIGRNAFGNCRKLETVLGLIGVKECGDNAFANCISLDGAIMPPNMDNLGATIFRNNPNTIYYRMAEVNMHALNPQWNADMASTGKTICLDETQLAYNAIMNDGEIIGYSVKKQQNIIDDNDYILLNTYNGLPVLEIEEEAFWYCTFNSLTITCEDKNFNTSINIRNEAFMGVTADYINIEVDITLNEENTPNDYYEFEMNKSTGVFSGALIRSITLPDSITALPRYMFNGCNILEEISFSNPNLGVNHLSPKIKSIGSGAFASCSSLSEIYVPNSIMNMGEAVFELWGQSPQIIYMDFYQENKNWNKNWKIDMRNKAIIEYKKAEITLEKEGGQENIGTNVVYALVNYDMPMATAPRRKGYDFKGYYFEPNGKGQPYYNEDMSSAQVWNIEADATLYAHWEIITYTISYYAGASFYTDTENNPTTYTVEDEVTIEDHTLIYSKDDGKTTTKYIVKWDKHFIPKGSTGDVTVYGGYNIDVMPDMNNIGIFNVDAVVVNLPDRIGNYCDINIDSDVTIVSIRGNGDADYYYPLRININNENSVSYLNLIDVKIKNSLAGTTISANENQCLMLSARGEVEVIGGDSDLMGFPGGEAIRCGELSVFVMTNDDPFIDDAVNSLLIQGGNGADGGILYLKDIAITTNAGDAGAAVYVAQNKVTISSGSITFRAGLAGNGGNSVNATQISKGGKGAMPIVGTEDEVVLYIAQGLVLNRDFFLYYSIDGADGKYTGGGSGGDIGLEPPKFDNWIILTPDPDIIIPF